MFYAASQDALSSPNLPQVHAAHRTHDEAAIQRRAAQIRAYLVLLRLRRLHVRRLLRRRHCCCDGFSASTALTRGAAGVFLVVVIPRHQVLSLFGLARRIRITIDCARGGLAQCRTTLICNGGQPAKSLVQAHRNMLRCRIRGGVFELRQMLSEAGRARSPRPGRLRTKCYRCTVEHGN